MNTMTWRTSSFTSNGTCVAMADLGGNTVGIRDSKLGDESPVVELPRGVMAELVAGIKVGDVDHLA